MSRRAPVLLQSTRRLEAPAAPQAAVRRQPVPGRVHVLVQGAHRGKLPAAGPAEVGEGPKEDLVQDVGQLRRGVFRHVVWWWCLCVVMTIVAERRQVLVVNPKALRLLSGCSVGSQ